MLAEIFKAVLIMSGAGGILTVLLLAAKPVTRRVFGVKWQFYVWLSVLIVMLLPVKLSGGVKLPSVVSAGLKAITPKPAVGISVFEDYSGVYMSEAVQAESFDWFSFVAAVWLAVAAILLVKTVISNLALKSALYKSSFYYGGLGKAEIRISDAVAAPVLFGGVKAVLFIPEGVQSTDKMQYIAAHESVHLRRNDIGVKWLAALVKCVHWFNPMAYIAARQIDEGCEISCDAEAVRTMSNEQKREYMRTILDISQNEIGFRNVLTAGLSNGGRCLKKRFDAVYSTGKSSRVTYGFGVAAAAAITFCFVCACGIVRGSAEEGIEPAKLVLVAPKDGFATETVEDDIAAAEPEVKEETVQDIPKEENIPEPVTEEKPQPEAQQTAVIRGEFNSEGGDTRIIYGVTTDSNGCINLAISSNAQEVVDVFVNDGESGKEVHSFSIPVSHQAAYTIDGLDTEKKYNIVLKGTMRNNWKIESEYIIY